MINFFYVYSEVKNNNLSEGKLWKTQAPYRTLIYKHPLIVAVEQCN